MGYALAQAAIEAGANVNLISGPVTLEVNKNINLIKINTAKEMLDQVLKVMKDDDLFIGCAAVSDYRPKNYSVEKLKKNSKEIFNLKLEKMMIFFLMFQKIIQILLWLALQQKLKILKKILVKN